MAFDLSKMEEITCEDCGRPIIATPVEGTTQYRFFGCRCAKPVYVLPDCVKVWTEGGPMFFYRPVPGSICVSSF
jgi:hypothetical protein